MRMPVAAVVVVLGRLAQPVAVVAAMVLEPVWEISAQP
jgi:hypothetical protein